MAESPLLEISPGSYDPSLANEDPGVDITAGLAPPAFRRPRQAVAPVGFDPASRQVFVNGLTFDADDHQSAVESQNYLDQPPVEMPANFQPMGPDEYKGYLTRILDPSFGRLIKKNIGIGFDTSQELAGSALKFLGAEETGQAIVDQQEEDLRFNQPYQRQFTGIESPGGAAEWFVANAAQLAPLMLELILTSFVGAGVGGVAATTAGGAKLLGRIGASLTSRSGREGVAALARTALQKKARGEVLEAAEKKALRTVGRAAGSLIGGTAASYGVAIGDIYGEMEQTGTSNRLLAAFAAIPYAATEIAPGALAVTRAIKAFSQATKKGGRLRRGATGAAAGAAIEGSTEAIQEIINLGVTGELDLSDPEVQDRLINSFAAGAGVGAPLGGLANVGGRRAKIDTTKPEVDILDPEGEAEPEQGQVEAEERLLLEDQRGYRPEEEPEPRQIEGEERLSLPPPPIYAPGPVVDPTSFEAEPPLVTPPPVEPEVVYEVAPEVEALPPPTVELPPEVPPEPFNPAIADALAAAQARQVAQRQAVERPLQEAADVDLAAREEQFALQDEGRLAQAGFAKFSVTEGPMVLLPHVVEGTNQVVMHPVSARKALASTRRRVDALRDLTRCLSGKG